MNTDERRSRGSATREHRPDSSLICVYLCSSAAHQRLVFSLSSLCQPFAHSARIKSRCRLIGVSLPLPTFLTYTRHAVCSQIFGEAG